MSASLDICIRPYRRITNDASHTQRQIAGAESALSPSSSCVVKRTVIGSLRAPTDQLCKAQSYRGRPRAAASAKQGETMMKKLKSVTKLFAGLIFAGLLAVGGTSAASAQTASASFHITNSYGSTLTLDSASCSPSATISAPFTIGVGGTANFSATGGNGSLLCTVRYRNGSDGCQFVVFGTNFGGSPGGFTSSGAYMGDSTPPRCQVTLDGPATANGWQGSFTMSQ
jgi:hypothetical protein